MREFMEAAEELNVQTSLMKLLGVSEEKVKDIIENLDVDALTELIDACAKKDKAKVREIIGAEKMESDDENVDEPKSDDEDDKEPEIGALLLPKDKAKAIKAKKRELRRRKEELGEDDDASKTFALGDPVWVGEEEGTVKIPSAPGDTVGVMVNGELKMVDKSDVEKLDEGVLGMTPLPGLQRMMELAGLPPVSASEPEPLSFDEPPPPADMAAPDMAPPEPAMTVADEGDMAPDMDDDMGGMDAPLPPAAPGTPELPAPALPPAAEVPPAPGGIPALGSALEDAAALDQAISDIEGMIPNVKISDYKTVVARLEALVALAKSTGKQAIAESVSAFKREAAPKVTTIKKDKAKPFVGTVSAKPVKESEEEEIDEGEITYDYRAKSGDHAKRVRDILGGDGEAKKKGDEAPKGMKAAPKSDKPVFGKRVSEGEDSEKEVDEDSLDTDGDGKADAPPKEEKKDRKTLMDYVREAEEGETLGKNNSDAVKAVQAKMGKTASTSDASKALNTLRSKGLVKNGPDGVKLDAAVSDVLGGADEKKM